MNKEIKLGDVYYEKHTVVGISKRTGEISETEVEEINMIPIPKMEGYVVESRVCCNRKTYVKPIVHDYSDKDHPNYFKYSCPVCDSFGNPHQVMKYEKNCPLCNVNLYWGEEE